MAADYALMKSHFSSFYDFKDKRLIYIGAGGKHSIDENHLPSKIIAIDRDAHALETVRLDVSTSSFAPLFEFVLGDFLSIDLPVAGDAVLFEFCLHEMSDTLRALTRAAKLAPEIVIYDHSVDSEWAYYVVEDIKTTLSWQAVKTLPIRKLQQYNQVQRFRDYAELRNKVAPQGEIAIQRIEKFRNKTDIVIPFSYTLALVQLV